MKKLNLGCGKDIKSNKEGWINLDEIKAPGVNIIHNLNKFPYPFKKNEFDYIFCSHILEHVKDLKKTFKELVRITKNNGIIKIRSPHFSSGVTYMDPSHKTFFSYFTFNFLFLYDNSGKKNFKIKKRNFNFTRTKFIFLNPIINPLLNLSPMMYERFFCWIFPTSEIIYEIIIKK